MQNQLETDHYKSGLNTQIQIKTSSKKKPASNESAKCKMDIEICVCMSHGAVAQPLCAFYKVHK